MRQSVTWSRAACSPDAALGMRGGWPSGAPLRHNQDRPSPAVPALNEGAAHP